MQSILRIILIVVSILLLLVGFFIEDIAMVAISSLLAIAVWLWEFFVHDCDCRNKMCP